MFTSYHRVLRSCAAGAALLLSTATPSLEAGVPIGIPAQEMTQLMNYAQLFKQLLTDAEQLKQQFAQVQWAIYNSKNLVQHPTTAIMGDLQMLGNIVSRSQGLAYNMGALDKQFSAMYPTYDPHQQWYGQYAQWSANTIKTLNGTLASAGMQGANLMNEQQTLQQLRALTSSSMGQNQAAQVGAIGTQEMISQLVKLRQFMVTDMQQKAAVTGYTISQEDAKQQAKIAAFPGTDWQADQRSW